MNITYYKSEYNLPLSIYDAFLLRIPKDKKEEIVRCGNSKETEVRLCAYVCLRYALSKALSIDNKELLILKDKNQKPYIDRNIYFNLSHTKDAFAFSLSKAQVGIDIEKDREVSSGVMNRIFTQEERESVINSTDAIKIWTQKEAVSKLYGAGIKMMSSIDTLHQNIVYISSRRQDEHTISVASFEKDEWVFEIIDQKELIENGLSLSEISL